MLYDVQIYLLCRDGIPVRYFRVYVDLIDVGVGMLKITDETGEREVRYPLTSISKYIVKETDNARKILQS